MKKLFYLVAAATLLFASCQKELSPAEQSKSNEILTFKASIEQLAEPGTKGTINASNQLVWAENDLIGIYFPDWGDKNQPFRLAAEDAGKTQGSFSIATAANPSGASATAAYYPWEPEGSTTYPGDWQNNVYNGVMYFKLRDNYYSYASGKMLTPLVAKITSSTDPIAFKHAGAAVKLIINNLVEGTYKVKMSVAGKQITGGFHVNPANAGSESLALDATENTTLNTVTLNTYKGSGAFTWIFPVPTLTTPKLTFEVIDDNGVSVWSKTPKTQSSLSRGDILVMPAVSISPYQQFNSNADWSVCGDPNGWGDTKMVTDGKLCIAKNVTFAANQQFKIRKYGDSAWEQANYGYDQLNGIIGESESKDKWHVNATYGTENNNLKITTAGTYDIIFNSSESDYCGYKSHEIRVVQNGFPYPIPAETITLDGSFSDWASVTPVGGPNGGYTQCKATYDADYIYFYSKTTGITWDAGNYIYYCLDTDNDNTSGGDLWGHAGFESIFYIHPLSSTSGTFNTTPSINRSYPSSVSASATLAGTYNSSDGIIEVELKVPRTAALVSKGNTIRIWTYASGSSSGYFTLAGTLIVTK